MNPTEHPITEDDIANFLANTPDFFERHAEVLAAVQLSSGHGTRAVSLQERQASMLREKIKGLETRVVDMIRHGQENVSIADKLQSWTRRLLQTAQARELPAAVVSGITAEFQIPQAAIKVWRVNGIFSDESFVSGVSDDAQTFAESLSAPYCGVNSGFEAIGWLPDPTTAMSVALIPLRPAADEPVSGLLVLASPDSARFHPDMGTDFLERLGELAGAALSRLRVQGKAHQAPMH
ncbi:MAG: hypothetical protein B7Y03_02140 [Polaromonas sp. 24-62-144]|jgi:uncharacterized protein YigA (DUF484 family)|uniref:DUF484 family protein n=1 Tax=Polaromonas sp. TaxID=1869339 RepID=UPI000BDD3685|nr:DUF484 family protein [Polaromonas sp.]OYZ84752.1 MAG: hypothetical protein B7Y03_02140 [Polaromonas sp. 24-62-144]HQS31280.1 DUF484 family protein [Polaromonas sp.]HQS90392.1 DUF484 family protein [Polaromonas sp.]